VSAQENAANTFPENGVGDPGRVVSLQISVECDHLRLVDGAHERHQVAQFCDHPMAVAFEGRQCVRAQPATLTGEPSGQGEVVQRDESGHPGVAQGAQHSPVVRDRGAAELAGSRFDARPLQGEPVGVVAE